MSCRQILRSLTTSWLSVHLLKPWHDIIFQVLHTLCPSASQSSRALSNSRVFQFADCHLFFIWSFTYFQLVPFYFNMFEGHFCISIANNSVFHFKYSVFWNKSGNIYSSAKSIVLDQHWFLLLVKQRSSFLVSFILLSIRKVQILAHTCANLSTCVNTDTRMHSPT